MANFCSYCGRPLMNGEPCPCQKKNQLFNVEFVQSQVEAVKNHMGIGDPELNKGDAYEKGKKIVPDCINPSEGEVPVKQYEVATLRNRVLGIPYMKAVGRMQVTNKRVVFRAPGKGLAGRTTLQHEFSIDELAGVEARREYVFRFMDWLIGSFAMIFGGSFVSALIATICKNISGKGAIVVAFIMAFMFGVAGCVPFVLLKKKWLLKLLCLGGSCIPMLWCGVVAQLLGGFYGPAAKFFGGVLIFLGAISLICAIFSLFVYSIRPNLVLLIKTKAAGEAIDIKRKKHGFFVSGDEEHTGYTEVLPADDAERCIREIDAIITDIQKLGDFGMEKWMS